MAEATSSETTATKHRPLVDRVGWGTPAVKYGSKLVPLSLLALMVVLFLVSQIETGRTFLAENFAQICQASRSAADKAALSPVASPPGQDTGAAVPASGPDNPGATGGAAQKAGERVLTGLAAECMTVGDSRKDIATLKSEFRAKPSLTAMAEELSPFTTEELGGFRGIWIVGKAFAKSYLDDLVHAFREHASGVAAMIGTAALYALIPGIAGLVYRRSFATWFAIAFVVLLAIKSFAQIGTSVGQNAAQEAGTLFVLVVSQLIVLLLANRLRRYSNSAVSMAIPSGIYNKLLAAVLFAIAIAVGIFDQGASVWPYIAGQSWAIQKLIKWEFILIGLPLVYSLARRNSQWSGSEPKNIVVCLDGTNNTPDQYELGQLAQTNVFKLFRMLKADAPRPGSGKDAFDATICKRYKDKQIGFYYIGVGNRFENSSVGQALGQAMGMGASGLVDRAYLDVMRVYQPGDRIYIFGFSRGAAIARLLARAIDQRGAPKSVWTLRLLGRHWVVWKSKRAVQQVGGVPIAVLGCWDTVGAFGIAKTIAGIDFQKIDMFKDLSIPDNVQQAYHLVALDEQRDSFAPTLMEPDPINPGRIVEVWFSGDHANIGGGWATPKLSDVTLDFMLRHVSSGYAFEKSMKPGDETWGLCLDAVKIGHIDAKDPAVAQSAVVDPDPLGQLRQWTSLLYTYLPRKLPLHAVIADTVFERMTRSLPVYAPQSLFDHNEELDKKRETVNTAVCRLTETQSLSTEERTAILEFKDKLRLVRWSQHHEDLRARGVAPVPAARLPFVRSIPSVRA